MATFVLTVLHGGVHELGAPGLIQLGDQDLKEFFTVVEVFSMTHSEKPRTCLY